MSDARRNRGPKRRGLCRIRHAWFIGSVDMSGHQSSRTRYCARKGCTAQQRQRRGYFGGSVGSPWQWWPIFLWCGHGVDGRNLPACMRCAVERQEAFR